MKYLGILTLIVLIGLGVAARAGAQERLSAAELTALLSREQGAPILIDVRTPEEFASGAIPGAINIPYDLLADKLPTTDRNAEVVVYCRSGRRSAIARRTLEALGFTRVLDFGGIDRWRGELVLPEKTD
jgi:phage shock protein E